MFRLPSLSWHIYHWKLTRRSMFEQWGCKFYQIVFGSKDSHRRFIDKNLHIWLSWSNECLWKLAHVPRKKILKTRPMKNVETVIFQVFSLTVKYLQSEASVISSLQTNVGYCNFEYNLKAQAYVEPMKHPGYNRIATDRCLPFYAKPLLRIYIVCLVGLFFASKSWPA